VNDAAMTRALVAAVAFVVSLAGVRLVEQQARRVRLVDLPNVRSSHVEPRPRGGGLGIILGVLVAALAGTAFDAPLSREVAIVLGGAVLVAAVGLWDDIRGLGVWPRLAVQAVAAIGVVAAIGGLDRAPLPPPADVPLGPLGSLVAVVWIVGATNFFNFMDGLDGLAAGQAVITLAAFASVTWPGSAAGLAVLCASASAAFLLRNWSPARIFLGDVGSAFLGFVLAALPLAAPERNRSPLVLIVGISLALFLLDPVATLMARARRGAVVGASHREHAYQQFVAPGGSHAPVVVRLLLVAVVLSGLAVAAASRPMFAWPATIAALVAFAIEWQLAARRRVRSA
jgi:UDP-N-acetylmuramyl pentapeptide phosphotransferase/UDP-N-acetylglucosamine-1-phosphate transferase